MSPKPQNTRLAEPIAVIGAGMAGLITAHTLIRDGFTNVQIFTRDAQVGGVWARDRIYPNLHLNNVHGGYRFSQLEMPPPIRPDGFITGDDMANYVETFADKFLKGHIKLSNEVRNIRRHPQGSSRGWQLDVYDLHSGEKTVCEYAKIVLCTGGCSAPRIPDKLSPEAAAAAGFKGIVLHSADFSNSMDALLARTTAHQDTLDSETAVVVGGGRSAQDICAFLAREGRDVTMVCHKLDAFTAGAKPLPAFIRKSRIFALFSPHIHLRTALERFLHTTWLGKTIVDWFWRGLADRSFKAANIPQDSPLRNTVSLFWHSKVNNEGVPRANGFHSLAVAGKIRVFTPAHADKFSEDGRSVVLKDGRLLRASAVVLATGYASSWSDLFHPETFEDLGLNPQPAGDGAAYQWDYTTLSDGPPLHQGAKQWSSSLYKALVPARNIASRDFAVNGACVSTNNGYTMEVASHWISSYFLGDDMRIPETPELALAETERQAAWLKRRYPEIPTALDASHTACIAFWTWPQHVDDLLEEMGLPVLRGGGNALTWPFKVIDLEEIRHLKEERDALRRTRDVGHGNS